MGGEYPRLYNKIYNTCASSCGSGYHESNGECIEDSS